MGWAGGVAGPGLSPTSLVAAFLVQGPCTGFCSVLVRPCAGLTQHLTRAREKRKKKGGSGGIQMFRYIFQNSMSQAIKIRGHPVK